MTTDTRPEPALIVSVIAAGLSLIAGFGPDWLTPEQTAIAITAINAVAALVIGWRVRPVVPGLFTGVVGAVAALVAAYGYDVGQEAVGGINAFVIAILALLVRGQVTPVQDKAVV